MRIQFILEIYVYRPKRETKMKTKAATINDSFKQYIFLTQLYFSGEQVRFEGRLITTQISRLQNDFDGSSDAKEIKKLVKKFCHDIDTFDFHPFTAQKMKFCIKISSLNVTKSCRFGLIY